MPNRILLGTGILTWHRSERITDRYGTVMLCEHGPHNPLLDRPHVQFPALPAQRGRLVAEVTETRQSGHIGDFFRGLSPTTPEPGAVITLGEGTLFFEGDSVGLEPADGRKSDWLDPCMLYNVHEQTVRLYFEPTA